MTSLRNIVAQVTPLEMHSRLFIVGGAVRDSLMGISKCHDLDVVLDRGQETDIASLEAAGFAQVSNKTFPVFVKVVDEIEIQIGFGREEQHEGDAHNDVRLVALDVPVEKDALRRDLTINALMVRVSDGEVLDFVGGVSDLESRVLRPCSPAFVDDSERAFRAFRFAAQLDFSVSSELVEMCRECSRKFHALSQERVFNETMKAMKTRAPWRFFQEMVSAGVGQEFFPEIFAMVGIPAGPRSSRHGDEDVFEHSMDVLRRVSEISADPATRLAAVFHDVGKVETPRGEWPSHHGHALRGGEMVPRIMKRMRADSSTAEVCRLAASHHMKATHALEMKASSWLETAREVGEHRQALCDVCLADSGEDISRWMEAASRCMKISATEMGLVERIQGKKGEAVKNIVWEARVSRMKKAMKDLVGQT